MWLDGSGTPSYMSPELMQRKRADAKASDVWALGAILYELITGRLAFTDTFKTTSDFQHEISDMTFNFFSYDLVLLIRKMLHLNFRERLTVTAVLENDWFNPLEIATKKRRKRIRKINECSALKLRTELNLPAITADPVTKKELVWHTINGKRKLVMMLDYR